MKTETPMYVVSSFEIKNSAASETRRPWHFLSRFLHCFCSCVTYSPASSTDQPNNKHSCSLWSHADLSQALTVDLNIHLPDDFGAYFFNNWRSIFEPVVACQSAIAVAKVYVISRRDRVHFLSLLVIGLDVSAHGYQNQSWPQLGSLLLLHKRTVHFFPDTFSALNLHYTLP